MSWNNYNIGIPHRLIELGPLVRLSTGNTLNGTTHPGPIYKDYRCTSLLAMVDNPELTVNNQYNSGGLNLVLTGPKKGHQMAWNFTGFDVINWNSVSGVAAAQDWVAMCYCTDPCNFPSTRTMSGQTLSGQIGYGSDVTNIGGDVWNNVTPGSGSI